jgi:hypothetical protein
MLKRTLVLVPALLLCGLAAGDAQAADADVALGEISVTSPTPGVDYFTLKNAAQLELQGMNAVRVPKKRRYVVSFSVVRTTDSPVACQVNAMLRDGKSGSMLAIIEGSARAEGGASAALRTAVLRAAVHTAVEQIPAAVTAK